MRILSWISLLLLGLPAFSPAQKPASTPQALLAKAIALERGEQQSLPRYTYFMLEHTQNRTQKGKLFLDTTTLYEYTWIGDLPYGRVVELQGKPIKGKALAQEQARYEKAVADHAGLDVDERAKAKKYYVVNTGQRLEPLLTAAYAVHELRQETVNGYPTYVLDCSPVPAGNVAAPNATRHVTLWITDAGLILRETYELVADEADKRVGSHGEADFQLIDGNRLPQHTSFHLNSPNGNTGDFEDTYTRYRRFTVSTRVIPVDSGTGSDSTPQP